jgi:hypothetical protein
MSAEKAMANGSKMVYDKCRDHDGEAIKLFCETCDMAICALCRLRGHPSDECTTMPLSQAAARQKAALQETVDQVEDRLNTMVSGLNLLASIGDTLLAGDAICLLSYFPPSHNTSGRSPFP